MAYDDVLKQTDEIIENLRVYIETLRDDFIKSKYTGFIAISAVTAYELAIKEILITFAEKENSMLGRFMAGNLERFNVRIQIEDLKNEYLKKFGNNYENKFKQETGNIAPEISSAYKNMIILRHQCVHKGSHETTYQQAIDFYRLGKEVVYCLYRTLHEDS